MSKRRSGPNPFAPTTPKHLRFKRESDTPLTLTSHQTEILRRCVSEQELTELMDIAETASRAECRNEILPPLLKAGLLEMTIPQKSRSSKQQFRLTAKGMDYLKRLRIDS